MVRERSERGGEASPSQPPSGLSVAEIRQLITLMQSNDLDEVTIERESEGLKLALRRARTAGNSADGEEDADFDEAVSSGEKPKGHTAVEIGAPLVGIFRVSMKGDKPLVRQGDIVRQGQIIAAIEALKVLNEVEAQTAGRITEILAVDGQAVEYGQTLLVIEPS